MTRSFNSPPDLLDWEPLSETSIDLSPEQIDRATARCQNIFDPDRQWQTYLHLLGLSGFEQWLQERSPDLELNLENCLLLQPQWVNLIGSVCNLQIGNFQLCLIATGSLPDALVHLPRAILESPALLAHFYVLVEVLEEQSQVNIQGYCSALQVSAHQSATPLRPNPDHTYSLPVSNFQPDPSALLLNLRCLDPAAIPLPQPLLPANPTQTQQKLTRLLPPATPLTPQLTQTLCEHLTWEEKLALLAHPEWLELPTSPPVPVLQPPQPQSNPSTVRGVLNVATWLQGQLDSFAEQLSWVLMPPVFEPVALRSTSIEQDWMLELMQNGIAIPTTVARACHDFEWAGSALRLQVLTWEVLESDQPEWVLLAVLGAQFQSRLPLGVKLRIQDETQLLVEQELLESDQMYIYAQVIGTQTESFQISLEQDGAVYSLPSFVFQPNPA